LFPCTFISGRVFAFGSGSGREVGSPKYHGLASCAMRTGAVRSAVSRIRGRRDLVFIS
jgi:hypothetical protein